MFALIISKEVVSVCDQKVTPDMVKVPDGVIVGMVKNKGGVFSLPKMDDDKIIAEAQQSIISFATHARTVISGGADSHKVSGWNVKLQAALRIKAGAGSSVDETTLKTELDHRESGESLDQFVDKIISNGESYGTAIGSIDGMESQALKQLENIKIKDISNLLENLTKRANQVLKSLLDRS